MVVLQRGTAMLLEHLAGSLASAITVSTQLDIAPQHHLAMMGRNGSNVKHIMQRTGAQVHFPDPNCPQKKSTVYIQGTIDSVCLARQYLMVKEPSFSVLFSSVLLTRSLFTSLFTVTLVVTCFCGLPQISGPSGRLREAEGKKTYFRVVSKNESGGGNAQGKRKEIA